MPYETLEPAAVWQHFAALNAIPRLSEHESAARDYVERTAQEAGAEWRRDNYGNVVVKLPANNGHVNATVVAVQAHLDMVPATATGMVHDFLVDPIVAHIEDGRVIASGTTLGADNGIGAAMGLALITERDIQHGPLELLFTVEEEIGLRGAANLGDAMLNAKYLINLDSEEVQKLTIGCTGGATLEIVLPTHSEKLDDGERVLNIAINGGKGGHSGIEIHQRRANTLQLVERAVRNLVSNGIVFRVQSLHGGTAANAIPGSMVAKIVVDESDAPLALDTLSAFAGGMRETWNEDEPYLDMVVSQSDEIERDQSAFDVATSKRLLSLLESLPHGVQQWSETYEGKVQTSVNLASVGCDGDAVRIVTSVRSFKRSDLDSFKKSIAHTASHYHAHTNVVSEYPGWEPASSSRLQKQTERAFLKVYGFAPEIEVVHAGLECGAILAKYPEMEAISFGPDIEGAHTPEESVTIATVESTWRLLVELIGSMTPR